MKARRILAAISLFALPLSTLVASAQDSPQSYPNRAIRIIVPFPAGGPTDNLARLLSQKLSTVLAQSVVIENRGGGAGGSVGAKAVATADPDGYTLLMAPGGSLTVGPAVHKNIGYDPFKAFTPVAQLIESSQAIGVHPDLPVKTLADIEAYAKSNPGRLTFGSQGFGVGPHLLIEMFKLDTGTNIIHVPYRGTAPMLSALVSGEIQMAIDPTTTMLPLIQAGKVRAIAVTTPTRSPELPGIPTTIEAGYPKMISTYWLGVVAPAGTQPEIVQKLNRAFRESLSSADVQQRLANLSATVKIGSPEEFGRMLVSEFALWKNIATSANINVD
jgi:tripartite-type tricarboxylate transporter receptor subunit TctC